MQVFETSSEHSKYLVDAADIHHEIAGATTKARQDEIDQMDKNKRVYTMARKGSLRKASDDTVYDRKANGRLVRMTTKETKAERKARKRANKLRGK